MRIMIKIAQFFNRLVLGKNYAIPYLEQCSKCKKGFIALYGERWGGKYYCNSCVKKSNKESAKFNKKIRTMSNKNLLKLAKELKDGK